MATFFSDVFNVDRKVVASYGAFDVSLITDLPLFIDPFLLFNSKKSEYQRLHAEIIRYMVFLREKSGGGAISEALLRAWYCFPEVKQNWLGFSVSGNEGHGLGIDFARALNSSLFQLFPEFGGERITRGSHLEKVCLVREGVGRDNISDFTTNLIKGYLLDFTQIFARDHLADAQCRVTAVSNVAFNYDTEVWGPATYRLPWVNGDYVLLTPKDLLTRDDTWINKAELVGDFESIPPSIPDQVLRAQVSNYFQRVLARPRGRAPSRQEKAEAAVRTIREFPDLIDYYIRLKEEQGGQAVSVSSERVRDSEVVFNDNTRFLQMLLERDGFYKAPPTTYEEAHQRLAYLKDVIENKGGHRVFYKNGRPVQYEKDLQIMFRLVWFGTPSDVTTEANDGRGPADFKISRGAKDKTIVEMKLAKNTALKRNLERQTLVYQKASDARTGIKAIVYFTPEEKLRVSAILRALNLEGSRDVVLIDAQSDNKPSGSRA